mmetsp:Transcript_37758/g.119136  ORF Transcript_37758/g.119136 Transcript_37758/m.119136 type:complete len:346 (+) Transcript_37758:39-1076(+)
MPKSRKGMPVPMEDDDDLYEMHARSHRSDSSIYRKIGILIAAIVFLIAGNPIISVPAGHSAVVDFFGFVSKNTIGSGVHIKTLFARANLFSLKTRLMDVQQDAPTTEGLIVQLEVSVLYHVRPESVRDLYLTLGVNYDKVLVLPEVTSTIRSLTSKFSAKNLYSEGRDEMSKGIAKQLNDKLHPRGIAVEQALLRKVVLPKLVTTAIEEKLRAEQDSQRMEFVLMKEKQEAERKAIEAKGIADFQTIVSEGINPQLLEWKGIEATEHLAMSGNSKVVVIGNSNNGLPLILDHGSRSSSSNRKTLGEEGGGGPPARPRGAASALKIRGNTGLGTAGTSMTELTSQS